MKILYQLRRNFWLLLGDIAAQVGYRLGKNHWGMRYGSRAYNVWAEARNKGIYLKG